MGMRYIVHVPTSTNGRVLERAERMSQAAIANGYGVAPVPADDNEHKRNGRPCAACSCVMQSAAHHSTDLVEVHHGSADPAIVCGFHAQDNMLQDALREAP